MNADRSSFSLALTQVLMGSMTNWYGADNWDYERFGPHKASFKSFLISKLNELSSRRVSIVPRDVSHELVNLSAIQGSIEKLSALYDLLEDEPSKSTLVMLVAFRIMGYKRVKLPLNTSSYWPDRESARSLIKGKDTIKIKFHNWALSRFELDDIGYPIELFFLPGGVFANFILKQYEYRKRSPAITAQEGDYVIDAGGCWGDTALYFAHMVGARGRVYAFEFVPENLDVFKQNMDLNPELAERIELVPKALWNKSDEEIAYSYNGPGTSLGASQDGSVKVSTLSIDDFVSKENLARVDFIKMDIEGAELLALRGAEETIRKFKPTLGISVYHKESDLTDIPRYIDGLDTGYKFFLDHFTIHQEETVLFAIPGGK